MQTNAADLVGANGADLNGQILDLGGEPLDIIGFVWDDESHGDPGDVAPVDSDYEFSMTQGGSFSSFDEFDTTIGDLTPETQYWFRVCGHNSAGWDYGDELTFTTTA